MFEKRSHWIKKLSPKNLYFYMLGKSLMSLGLGIVLVNYFTFDETIGWILVILGFILSITIAIHNFKKK